MSIKIIYWTEKDIRQMRTLLAELDSWNNKESNLISLAANTDILISTFQEFDFYPEMFKEWQIIEEVNAVELDKNSLKSDNSKLLSGAVNRLRNIVIRSLPINKGE